MKEKIKKLLGANMNIDLTSNGYSSINNMENFMIKR